MRDQREPEIACEEGSRPDEVLLVDRTVQAVQPAKGFLELRRSLQPELNGDGIARDQPDDEENDDAADDEDCKRTQQPTEDIPSHLTQIALGRGLQEVKVTPTWRGSGCASARSG